MKVKSTLPQWLKIQKNPYTAPMRTTYGKQGSRGTGLHAGTSKLARRTSTSECALTSRENDSSLSIVQQHNQESSRVINNRRGPLKRAPHKAESGTRRMSTPSCKVAKVDSQSRQSRESISITVHCRLDETTPSSPLLGRRYPLQGVGRAYRDLRAQSCTKSSFTSAGQYTKQLS